MIIIVKFNFYLYVKSQLLNFSKKDTAFSNSKIADLMNYIGSNMNYQGSDDGRAEPVTI